MKYLQCRVCKRKIQLNSRRTIIVAKALPRDTAEITEKDLTEAGFIRLVGHYMYFHDCKYNPVDKRALAVP